MILWWWWRYNMIAVLRWACTGTVRPGRSRLLSLAGTREQSIACSPIIPPPRIRRQPPSCRPRDGYAAVLRVSYAYGGTRAVGARNTRAAVAMVTARSRPAVVPISQISRVFLGSVRCGAFRGVMFRIQTGSFLLGVLWLDDETPGRQKHRLAL